MTIPYIYIYEVCTVPNQSSVMIPPRKAKQPTKDEDDHDERKKTKKSKAVKTGSTVRTGRDHNEDDSGDPKLDCKEGRCRLSP